MYLHSVTFSWSSLETHFSGMMPKLCVQPLQFDLTSSTVLGNSRKVHWWKALLPTGCSSESSGEDGRKKDVWHKYYNNSMHRRAKSSEGESSQLSRVCGRRRYEGKIWGGEETACSSSRMQASSVQRLSLLGSPFNSLAHFIAWHRVDLQ